MKTDSFHRELWYVTMDIRKFFRLSIQSMSITRNAATARNGNAAERRMCDNTDVRERLAAYFGKQIVSISLIPGRKKSDVSLVFDDSTTLRLQNKEGDGNNRGWSVDRRSLSKMPVDDAGRELLDNVCLKHTGDRPTAACPPTLISDLLLGSDPETAPTHFTHSIFHKETGELLHISIASVSDVLTSLTSSMYPTLVPKRTCVHISPLLYLQRKGGGSSDHAPNDIQLKLKSFPAGVLRVL